MARHVLWSEVDVQERITGEFNEALEDFDRLLAENINALADFARLVNG